MKLIYQKLKEGIFITIQRKNPKHVVFDKSLIEKLGAILFSNPLIKNFRKLEIVLLDQEDGKEIGYVLISDIEKGINRIYLHESTKGIGDLEGTLSHELSHIFHIRNNNVISIIAKNKNKIYRAWKSLRDSNKSFEGFNKNNREYWLDLRVALLDLLNYIIFEGIAEFWKLINLNKIDYTKASVIEYYNGVCIKQANRINIWLDSSYELLEEMIEESSTTKQKCNVCSSFMKPNFSEGITSCSICRVKIHDKSKNYKEKAQFFEKTLDDLPLIGYILGPHIYHVILVMFEGITFEQLAKIKYNKLLHLYEDAMHMIGLLPVFSIKHTDAIVIYPKHVAKIHQLRRRAKKVN